MLKRTGMQTRPRFIKMPLTFSVGLHFENSSRKGGISLAL